MQLNLTIDLAERFSAAVLMGADEKVLGEWVLDLGAASKPPRPCPHTKLARAWAHRPAISDAAKKTVASGGRIIVEDCHPVAINVKPVARVQGVLLLAFDDITGVEPTLVMPSIWQKGLGYRYKKGRSSKGWAKELYVELGHSTDYHGKALEDVRDATLMNVASHRGLIP
jgi:hypothetical protein